MKDQNIQSTFSFEALIPSDMALKALQVGVKKAEMPFASAFILSILAGAFIALGAIFSTTVTTGASSFLPYGITKLLGGVAFCLGLILVVIAGAELFTGNNLIVMAWADRQVSTVQLLRNWCIVYIGNFMGALITAAFILLSEHYSSAGGQMGATMLSIAKAKVSLAPLPAFILGMLCNGLVCLAVWLTYSSRTTTDKVLAILFPVSAFVAAGFEHCVANMYFVPVALFIKNFATPEFWLSIKASPGDFSALTWSSFILKNLIPVTIGNIVGGSGLVGGAYWYIYLRPNRQAIQKKSI